jgi:hypothetical protein
VTTPREPGLPLGAGREPAAEALRRWLADLLRPRVCVVTGSPGVGKSHLTAWLVAADLSTVRSINGAMSARGMIAETFTWALGEQLSVAGGDPETLVATLAGDTRRVVLAIGELDQSGLACDGGAARQIITDVLNPLLELPHVRLLVEGGPDIAGAFGVPAEVLDLDAPELTDPAAFTAWLGETATRWGIADPDRVAAAAALFPNAGMAELALRAGAADGPADNVVRRWLDAAPAQAGPALDALGLAHEPVDAATWQHLCAALLGDAERARQAISVAAPLVVRPDERYALSCRPLREAARRRLPQPAQAEYAIGYALHATLPNTGGRVDWAVAPPYTRAHLARHAAAAGVIDRLLADPGFLVHTDPFSVTAAIETVGEKAPPRLRKIWRFAGPGLVVTGEPAERAALLRSAALHHHDGEVARWFEPFASAAPWHTKWVDARPAEPGAARWSGPAVALTYGIGPRGGQLIVATATGQLHSVSPGDGSVVGRIAGRALEIRHLVALSDGAVVTLDAHGALRLTEPLTTGSRADRLNSLLNAAPSDTVDSKTVVAAVSAHAGPPRSALGANADASVLVVGDRAGTVRMWRLEPAPTVVEQALHQGPVTAVTCLSMAAGVWLSVSGGADGAVRLWAPGRDLMEEPVDARDVPVTAVAAAALKTGPAVAAAWSDGLIRLWDLATGEQTDLRLGFVVYALVIDDDGTAIVGSEHGTTALRLTPSALMVTVR